MTGMANGASPAPSGSVFASSEASPQSAALPAGSEPAFRPSPEQQQLLQQARAHAANLALQTAPRRDLAAHPASAGVNISGSGVAASKLQQRAASVAQALIAERKISAREIQAMLEKNEAALRMWNSLHRQQPPLQAQQNHKEWLKKCYLYRQQIGARLEVLASLADRQIAQEDAKSHGSAATKKSASSTPTANANRRGPVESQAMKMSPASAKSGSSTPGPRTAANIPSMGQSVFQESTAPATSGVQAQSFGTYGSSGASIMANVGMSGTSAALSSISPGTTAVSAAMAATSVAGMSAPMPTSQSSAFELAAFDPSSTATTQPYVNQAPNFMMNPATMALNAMGGASNGNGMMSAQQQFMMMQMQMPMGMNVGAAGMYAQPNMFANINYGMMSGGTNPLPMDPFNASLSGFGQPAMGFPGVQPSLNGAYGMPSSMQASQMMNQMGGGFPSMVPNSFQYAASSSAGMAPSTQSVNVQQVPQQQSQMYQSDPTANAQLYRTQQQLQQPPPQPPQQPPQQQQRPQDASSSTLLPDAMLFDDEDMSANLFEGFSDDAFLPLQ